MEAKAEIMPKTFLEVWRSAIADAQESGECGWVYKEVGLSNGKPVLLQVARTMHPSFMGIKPPKHDPVRDGQ